MERPDMRAAVCQLGIAPEVIYPRVTSGRGGEQAARSRSCPSTALTRLSVSSRPAWAFSASSRAVGRY